MPLTLLVPDLLPPADAPAAMRAVRLPGLEKWLARAVITREPARGAYGWLAADWGLAEPIAYAAIALAGDDAPRAGTWMRADPVHLRIERDLVALHDASVLDVGAEESKALLAALQALFRDDGLEFHGPAPERWYVRVPEAAMPRTTPLHAVIGRDIFNLLPHGAGPLNWRSMITEAQMVLSSHEANARREIEGQPAINSVWFWGEGALPATVAHRFADVVTGDAFARGLARLSGAASHPVPELLDQVRVPSTTGETLVVLDDLTRAFRRGDVDAWLVAARALDARWFAPAGAATARFGDLRIVMPGEADTVVATLTPSAKKWRLLRARRPLSHHA